MNSNNIQHAQTKQEIATIIESGAELRFIGLSGDSRIPMNVSKEADAEFMRLLEKEDPERYTNLMRNIRRDNPDVRMSEDQALTNFMLGLPTGQWRFAIIAGKGAPVSHLRKEADRLLHEGTAEEYAKALVALANAPDPVRPQSVALPALPPAYVPTSTARMCANTSSSHHPLPQEARSNARYCDRACQQEAYRHRTAV